MTTKITIVFRHKGLHHPLMIPQSHCNNERSQFSASVPPIESSQFLFLTHFVADVRSILYTIRSMDLIHGNDGVKNQTSTTKWVGNRNCEVSIGGTEAEN